MINLFKNLFSADSEQIANYVKNGALLVDVRTPQEYNAGSVPGAVNIPLDKIEKEIGKLKNNKNGIVVFCKSGGRSSQAANILKQHGISNVVNGGGWQNVMQAIPQN